MPQKKALSWWVYPFFFLLFHDKEYFREINIDFFMFLLVYLEKKKIHWNISFKIWIKERKGRECLVLISYLLPIPVEKDPPSKSFGTFRFRLRN